MKRMMRILVVAGAFIVVWGVQLATGGEDPADGISKIIPIESTTCLSVRVEVGTGEAVSGVRWFNGSGLENFAMVLAAPGVEAESPAYAEAVVMMENVGGQSDSWSEVTLPQPVTSTTGLLDIMFQYPTFYSPPQEGSPLGVGYADQEGIGLHYLSGDGENWLRISSRCKPLLEPVMGAGKSRVLVLGEPQQGEAEEDELPKVFTTGAFPNPFNPKATIRLSLPSGVHCLVRVYDIRGRLVRTVQDGFLEAGTRDVTWWGKDNQGQSVASGVYLVKSQLGEKTFTDRLVLLK